MPAFHDPEIVRNIIETLPVGLCVVDLQKKIQLWSDGAERITGHLRHAVIGHSCIGEPLLHCDQPGCEFCGEECPLARAIKTGRPAESVGFLHHKSGHEILVRIRAVPIRNGHGSIIGAAETFEDASATGVDHREHSLKLSSCMDHVTDVSSRALMDSHLRHHLATFVEVQEPFAVMCLRVENLEQFRSTYGAEAAASLLRVVARTIEAAVWKTDIVGRWSDDEFLVILSGCRDEDLSIVRERVRHMLANDSIEWWGERRSLRVTIGQATAQAGDTLETLMERIRKSLDAATVRQARARAAAESGSL
jgi:diguanylate cyclase (GGDEF)-like protein/PAS domain S-box-containing protein